MRNFQTQLKSRNLDEWKLKGIQGKTVVCDNVYEQNYTETEKLQMCKHLNWQNFQY